MLAGSAWRRLEAACVEAHPVEACGLLLGRSEGDRVRVLESAPAGNVAPSPERAFELAPADFVSAVRRADLLGLSVVGTYHSHPEGPAVPSAVDRARAETGWSHVVVSVVAGPAGPRVTAARAWLAPRPLLGELREQPLALESGRAREGFVWEPCSS